MRNPIMPELIYQLTLVSSPSLAPDGSRLAFVRSKIDPETREGRSQILMMTLPDGAAIPFTQGKKDSSPRFSPDGRVLAFLRLDERERPQIWLIPASGGEARPLTRMAGGVSEFAWSPDSRELAFVSDVDPDRPPDDHDPKKDPRTRVVRRVRYRFDTLGWRGDAHRHLFVIGLDNEPARQLTDGDWDDLSPAWSPDGTRLAFVSSRREDRDLTLNTEAYVISAAGGEPERWSADLCSIANLAWSPDGTRLIAISSDDEEVGTFWQGWLFILGLGRSPKKLTDDSVKPASGFPPILPAPPLRWTEDGRILFLADRRGESFLFEIRETGDGLRPIAGGGRWYSDLSLNAPAKKAIVLSIPPTSAGDLQLIDIDKGTQQQLTRSNEKYFEEHPTAHLEKFTLHRADMEIESRLFFPPDFDPSQKYPLIVDVHGGPHGVFYDTFNAIQQVLATSGYIVLGVNPRGSSTYGVEFGKAVLRDWGGEDYLDIMAAVDAVCTRPYIDSDRLGVHGYSYGGFMSAWIIGQTHRFRAAVVGAPCIDLPSFYGTSDIGISFGEVQWGGLRKDALDAFLTHSPLTYAPKVETPVLLLHGEADHRCPIEQSEQYFVTLKRLGKEVEFVRFPGCSHLFLRNGHPQLRAEYLSRMKGWFDRHLAGKASKRQAGRSLSALAKR